MLTLWVAHNTAESSSSMLHETDRERYGSDCTPVNGVTWYLARYNGCHPRTASLQTVFLIATIFDRVSPRIAIRVTKLIPADDFSCTGRVRPGETSETITVFDNCAQTKSCRPSCFFSLRNERNLKIAKLFHIRNIVRFDEMNVFTKNINLFLRR